MAADRTFDDTVEKILAREKRYRREAYAFLNDAVAYTVRKYQTSLLPRRTRHVTGQELIRGVVEFARTQFGPLAWMVLEDWNLKTGSDVGEVVFLMIREGLLTASPDDSPADFHTSGTLRELFPEPEKIFPEPPHGPKIA